MDRSVDRTTGRHLGIELKSRAHGVRAGAGLIQQAQRDNPECYAVVMAAIVQPGSSALSAISLVWDQFFPGQPARLIPVVPTARFDFVVSTCRDGLPYDPFPDVATGWMTAYLDYLGARRILVSPATEDAQTSDRTLQCRFSLSSGRRRVAVKRALQWLSHHADLLTRDSAPPPGACAYNGSPRREIETQTRPIVSPNNVVLGCHDLTTRELEIVDLISHGLGNAAIAGQLEIAESTVKKHINRIFHKTGCQSRYELIVCRPESITLHPPSNGLQQ